MDPAIGPVMPPNFIYDRFVHFRCNNIDNIATNLDGNNSFHATQVLACQEGPESHIGFQTINPSSTTTLQVPEVMEAILLAPVLEGKVEPKSIAHTHKE